MIEEFPESLNVVIDADLENEDVMILSQLMFMVTRDRELPAGVRSFAEQVREVTACVMQGRQLERHWDLNPDAWEPILPQLTGIRLYWRSVWSFWSYQYGIRRWALLLGTVGCALFGGALTRLNFKQKATREHH